MKKAKRIKKEIKKRTYPLVFTNNETLLTIIFALLVMGIAQAVATFLGVGYVIMGLPAAIGQIITSVMYIIITGFGIRLICRNYLHVTESDCKIEKIRIHPVWIAGAIAMPVFVVVIMLFMPGSWENSSLGAVNNLTVVIAAVFYYGIASAVVEELIFRGMIMSAVEYRFGKRVALLAPALFFGILQASGCQSIVSVIQVMITETAMGILFSLIVYQSKNIWNAVLMHGVWNLVISGGILHIGESADEASIFNYVLDSRVALLTGGDLGVEASLDAMIAYILFAVLAFCLWQRGTSKKTKE